MAGPGEGLPPAADPSPCPLRALIPSRGPILMTAGNPLPSQGPASRDHHVVGISTCESVGTHSAGNSDQISVVQAGGAAANEVSPGVSGRAGGSPPGPRCRPGKPVPFGLCEQVHPRWGRQVLAWGARGHGAHPGGAHQALGDGLLMRRELSAQRRVAWVAGAVS